MTPERWHQITEIYHAARERDSARRDAFVAEQCLGDPTLQREVEAMLDGLDDAGQFGESPLFTSASSLEPGSLARRDTAGRSALVLDRTKSSRRSAPVGWARSIAPTIPA